LLRLLPAAYPEFSAADAEHVRALSDQALADLTDAVALRKSWAEIQQFLSQQPD